MKVEGSTVFDSPSARGELKEKVRALQQLETTVEHFAIGVAELSASPGSHAKGLDPRFVWALLDEAHAHEGQAREALSDAFEQLGEFAAMLHAQLQSLVLAPLNDYRHSLTAAQKRARDFDEESEALDAARLRALGQNKEAPLELRAVAQQEIDVKAAAAEVSWHDTACALREAEAQRRMLPQKAIGELLLAQLAYHQSCARLLSGTVEGVSALLAEAEAGAKHNAKRREAEDSLRAAMVTPASGGTQDPGADAALFQGWLQWSPSARLLGRSADVSSLPLLKPWSKRWFVLGADGKLRCFKSAEEASGGEGNCGRPGDASMHQQTKQTLAQSTALVAQIDLHLLSGANAVSGPGADFELWLGAEALRLRAADATQRGAWLTVLTEYLCSHVAECEAAAAATRRRFAMPEGRAHALSLEGTAHARSQIEGWLHRQDSDMLRRTRKCWVSVSDGELSCTLFDSVRISEVPRGAERRSLRGGAAARATPHVAQCLQPFKVLGSTRLPLATVSVREVRDGLPFAFELLSPAQKTGGSLVLQASSAEEMQLWTRVIRNGISDALGGAAAQEAGPENALLLSIRSAPGNEAKQRNAY